VNKKLETRTSEDALLLTKPEAAGTLKISLRQVDYLIEQGRLTKVKIGTAARITRESVLRLAGYQEAAE
jgi:excisionase family DNA binding protein